VSFDDPALVASPCVLECHHDAAFGACTGCGRTLEEIAAWLMADARTRRAIRASAAARISARRLAMLSEAQQSTQRDEAMADPILFLGKVDWSGENPGISLKTDPNGPFTALASFFRVVLSPHGRGHALVLLSAPQDGASAGNMCLTDNETMARYLVADFVSHFGAWRGLPGLAGLKYRALDSVVASGDPLSSYSETVKAGDTTVKLTWSGLGAPFCFAFRPENSATGKHHMPSLFVGCETATIEINGKALPGKPLPRTVAGQNISTAMLAFSETWITA
jgi:predicted Fe-S protein YdhL (DUF1289 family)